MKNLKSIIFSILISLLFQVKAQQVDVTFGPVLKHASRSGLDNMLGQYENNFYLIRSGIGRSSDDKTIELYDSKLNIISSKPIIRPNEDLQYNNIFLIDGKLYVFFTFYNKEKSTNSLLAATFSKDGKINGTPQELTSMTAENKRSLGSYSVDTSRGDGGKSFIILESPGYDKKEKEKFNFLVHDRQFKLKQKIDVKLPYTDKDFMIKDYTLDSKGNIHLLASIVLKADERERGKSRYEHKVLSYFSANDELKEYDIDMGQNYLSEIKMKINSESDLLLSGFYSDRGDYGMRGVFFVKINTKTQKVTDNKVTEFSSEFLALFMSEKRAEKHQELVNYVVNEIVPKDDGGIVMISEYYDFKQVCFMDQNGNYRCSYHYYHNNIAVVNFDPSGNVIWWTNIPKKQHTVNDGGYMSGYSLVSSDKKLHFVFNDNPANLQITDPLKYKNMTAPRTAVTTLVSLDEDGKSTRTALFNTKENKCVMRPRFHLQTSDNELVMYADRWTSYMFARLKFKD